MNDIYDWLTLSNLVRVTAIALAFYDLVQILSIVFMFRRRLALDTESKLITAHAMAVASHIIPTSIGVVGLVIYAVIDLFYLMGVSMTWKGPTLITILGLLTYSLRNFSKAQSQMLVEARNWNRKSKEYNIGGKY